MRAIAQTKPYARPTPHNPSCARRRHPRANLFHHGHLGATASTAAEELIGLAADILDTQPGQTLVVADAEHFTVELLDKVKAQTNCDSWYRCPISRAGEKTAKTPPELFQ